MADYGPVVKGLDMPPTRSRPRPPSKAEKLECPTCGEQYDNKRELNRHMTKHEEDRPHECELCGDVFKQRGHLTQHYVHHTGRRDFVCELCSKDYAFKFDLNRHQKTHFITRHHCNQCDKGFVRVDSRDNHQAKCRYNERQALASRRAARVAAAQQQLQQLQQRTCTTVRSSDGAGPSHAATTSSLDRSLPSTSTARGGETVRDRSMMGVEGHGSLLSSSLPSSSRAAATAWTTSTTGRVQDGLAGLPMSMMGGGWPMTTSSDGSMEGLGSLPSFLTRSVENTTTAGLGMQLLGRGGSATAAVPATIFGGGGTARAQSLRMAGQRSRPSALASTSISHPSPLLLRSYRPDAATHDAGTHRIGQVTSASGTSLRVEREGREGRVESAGTSGGGNYRSMMGDESDLVASTSSSTPTPATKKQRKRKTAASTSLPPSLLFCAYCGVDCISRDELIGHLSLIHPDFPQIVESSSSSIRMQGGRGSSTATTSAAIGENGGTARQGSVVVSSLTQIGLRELQQMSSHSSSPSSSSLPNHTCDCGQVFCSANDLNAHVFTECRNTSAQERAPIFSSNLISPSLALDGRTTPTVLPERRPRARLIKQKNENCDSSPSTNRIAPSLARPDVTTPTVLPERRIKQEDENCGSSPSTNRIAPSLARKNLTTPTVLPEKRIKQEDEDCGSSPSTNRINTSLARPDVTTPTVLPERRIKQEEPEIIDTPSVGVTGGDAATPPSTPPIVNASSPLPLVAQSHSGLSTTVLPDKIIKKEEGCESPTSIGLPDGGRSSLLPASSIHQMNMNASNTLMFPPSSPMNLLRSPESPLSSPTESSEPDAKRIKIEDEPGPLVIVSMEEEEENCAPSFSKPSSDKAGNRLADFNGLTANDQNQMNASIQNSLMAPSSFPMSLLYPSLSSVMSLINPTELILASIQNNLMEANSSSSTPTASPFAFSSILAHGSQAASSSMIRAAVNTVTSTAASTGHEENRGIGNAMTSNEDNQMDMDPSNSHKAFAMNTSPLPSHFFKR